MGGEILDSNYFENNNDLTNNKTQEVGEGEGEGENFYEALNMPL